MFAGFILAIQNPGFFDEGNPPPSKFSVDHIPDLTGKVYIVTGGNTGIGYETVKELLKKGGKVYLAARSQAKAEEAILELKRETGREAIFLKLDLADLRSVKQAAEEFISKESRLDVLFNNAGIMVPPKDQFTVQGWDLQWGVNLVAPFLFIKLLLPILIQTAKSSPKGDVRIVNTSSSAHHWYHVQFDALRDSNARNSLCKEKLYGQSKHGMVAMSKEFSRQYYQQTGIVCTSLNPGNISTNLQQYMAGGKSNLKKYFLHSPDKGALTQLWAGTTEEGRELDGEFLKPWARVGVPNPGTQDPELGKKLWDELERSVVDFV